MIQGFGMNRKLFHYAAESVHFKPKETEVHSLKAQANLHNHTFIHQWSPFPALKEPYKSPSPLLAPHAESVFVKVSPPVCNILKKL